jgi:hypothetical protein
MAEMKGCWWIEEVKKDPKHFFNVLLKYIKVQGWKLPTPPHVELEILKGYILLNGKNNIRILN